MKPTTHKILAKLWHPARFPSIPELAGLSNPHHCHQFLLDIDSLIKLVIAVVETQLSSAENETMELYSCMLVMSFLLAINGLRGQCRKVVAAQPVWHSVSVQDWLLKNKKIMVIKSIQARLKMVSISSIQQCHDNKNSNTAQS